MSLWKNRLLGCLLAALCAFAPAAPGRADSNPASVPPDSSYALVGLAKVDGIVYACLLDRVKNEHFVLSNQITHDGLSLVSVSPLDASVLSIVVRKGPRTLTLGLGGGEPPLSTTASTQTTITTVKSASPDRALSLPTPPRGAPLPLLFRASASEIALDANQQTAVKQLRGDFIEQVRANPASATSVQAWKQAQRETDEEMRTLLGDDVFTRYQMAASQATVTPP